MRANACSKTKRVSNQDPCPPVPEIGSPQCSGNECLLREPSRPNRAAAGEARKQHDACLLPDSSDCEAFENLSAPSRGRPVLQPLGLLTEAFHASTPTVTITRPRQPAPRYPPTAQSLKRIPTSCAYHLPLSSAQWLTGGRRISHSPLEG